MKLRLAVALSALLFSVAARSGLADLPKTTDQPAAKSLFDPARHMRVAEVKPGMKGHGLSVFSGTKIERFEVEVISVLKNFNPTYDVILIKCKGMNLEHTGAVAGMSGSPIYLRDEQGRDRMIGAFAYGWPLTKDPLAGVQPIEYMLKVAGASQQPKGKENLPAAAGQSNAAPAVAPEGQSSGAGGASFRWSLADSPYFPELKFDNAARHAELGLRAGARTGLEGGAPQLQPLATPLMTAGLSPKMLKEVAPLFEMMGLTPMQAGGGGGAGANEKPAQIEPGSVLAVPLIIGDAEMTAIGTCTEVIGGKVFGFGHPFNNEGPVILPMGSGRINHIVPNLTTSFKLGVMTGTAGRIVADQQVGVAGEFGEVPPMVPIDLRVTYADGSPERKYHFDGVLHPRFTPLLCGVAMMSALSGAHDLPQYNTLDYDLTMEFANGQTIRVKNRAVNASPMELFSQIGMPLMTAADNPFERVMVSKLSGTIHVAGEARDAQIVQVNMPKTRYRPGEKIDAFVTIKPFRGEEVILPVEMALPADLVEGSYQLILSDYRRYLQDEQQSRPFRFTAERVEEVFDVLRDVTSIRRDALYLRLVRQPDGVAVGRTALPQLPSSRRTVLLGAGRSNTTRYVSSTVQTIPMQYVMNGANEFTITVDPKAKVGVGQPGPVNLDAQPEGALPTAEQPGAPEAE